MTVADHGAATANPRDINVVCAAAKSAFP
eukprot:COSAG05_NODE_15281_length_373_cov_1.113139_1_plen_28_part_10